MTNIYISYSRQDIEFLNKIKLSLNSLERTLNINLWSDGDISVGEDWSSAIKNSLNRADIAILLVSQNYLNSDYIMSVELPSILQKQKEKNRIIIPILLKHCLWYDSPLKKLQVLPRNGKPLTESNSIDKEIFEIINEIVALIKKIELEKYELRKQVELEEYELRKKVEFEKLKSNIINDSLYEKAIKGNSSQIKNIKDEANSSLKIEETLILLRETISILSKEVIEIKKRINSEDFINSQKSHILKNTMAKNVKYQVGLSFAGEDRSYVSQVADELLKLQMLVFYDEYETVDLWGKDLYQHLSDVYKNKCQYCVIFISKYYAEKLWTKHELRNAQAKAFEENREYILPARFDNTELPGMLPTIGYVNCNDLLPKQMADRIFEKLLRAI